MGQLTSQRGVVLKLRLAYNADQHLSILSAASWVPQFTEEIRWVCWSELISATGRSAQLVLTGDTENNAEWQLPCITMVEKVLGIGWLLLGVSRVATVGCHGCAFGRAWGSTYEDCKDKRGRLTLNATLQYVYLSTQKMNCTPLNDMLIRLLKYNQRPYWKVFWIDITIWH